MEIANEFILFSLNSKDVLILIFCVLFEPFEFPARNWRWQTRVRFSLCLSAFSLGVLMAQARKLDSKRHDKRQEGENLSWKFYTTFGSCRACHWIFVVFFFVRCKSFWLVDTKAMCGIQMSHEVIRTLQGLFQMATRPNRSCWCGGLNVNFKSSLVITLRKLHRVLEMNHFRKLIVLSCTQH